MWCHCQIDPCDSKLMRIRSTEKSGMWRHNRCHWNGKVVNPSAIALSWLEALQGVGDEHCREEHTNPASCWWWCFVYHHIEAETKWSTFSRQLIQMRFPEWKCFNLYIIWLKGTIANNTALVHWSAPSHYLFQWWPRLVTHICATRPQSVKYTYPEW